MNVRNEPVQEMYCVVKREARWRSAVGLPEVLFDIYAYLLGTGKLKCIDRNFTNSGTRTCLVQMIKWKQEFPNLISGEQDWFLELLNGSGLSGTWKMEMAKPKVEGKRIVGLILKEWGLYWGNSLVPIHQLFVPGGKLWMGEKRNIVSLPKHHISISHVFATLMRLIVRNQEWDPLVFTTPVGATHCFLQHLQFYQTPAD